MGKIINGYENETGDRTNVTETTLTDDPGVRNSRAWAEAKGGSGDKGDDQDKAGQ